MSETIEHETKYPQLNMTLLVYSSSEVSQWVNLETFEEQEFVYFRNEREQLTCGVRNLPTMRRSAQINLNNILDLGIWIDGKHILGYEALSQLLSRQLPIDAQKCQEMVEDALTKGFQRILWCRRSHLEGTQYSQNDSWLVLGDYPTEFDRDSYNVHLKNKGSKWRLKTPKISALLKKISFQQMKNL